MNGRSGLVTFFLFLFLAVMILLQVLSMVQSDRLYERLNSLVDRWESSRPLRIAGEREVAERPDLPMEEYPGDEGDWLVWHLSGEPTTLYDILASSTWSSRWIVNGNIFESLIEYKPDAFEYRGKLAEEFSISDDGLEIYFKLRDNIYFSDGVPITTDDVIFTFDQIAP